MLNHKIPMRPVPVVRALIDDGQGRVLLLRRAPGSIGGGSWCLPGGKIDYGQTADEAMAREVEEETSLRVTDAAFFLFQDSLPPEPGAMHCLNLYFVCRAEGTVRLNGESSDHIWASPDEAARLDIAFRNGEAVAKFFSRRV